MPRDKSQSHIRVINSAKEEFLKKGFDMASMRSIGEMAGMTPAGLYRHFPSKEALFDALVEPAITELLAWYENHKARSYSGIDAGASKADLFSSTMIDFMRDIVYPNEDAFRLLFTKAQGTKYENFLHDIVLVEQEEMLDALAYMRDRGHNVKMISRDEMHMIMSAYMTALLEPFVHGMSREDTLHSLKTVEDFFMPGWEKIMGY